MIFAASYVPAEPSLPTLGLVSELPERPPLRGRATLRKAPPSLLEKIPSTPGLVPSKAPRMNASPRLEIRPTGSRYTRRDRLVYPGCPVRRLRPPRPLPVEGVPLPAETAIKTRLPVSASSRFRGRSLFAGTRQTPGAASGRRLRLPLGTRPILLSFRILTRGKKHEFRTPITCAFRCALVHRSSSQNVAWQVSQLFHSFSNIRPSKKIYAPRAAIS